MQGQLTYIECAYIGRVFKRIVVPTGNENTYSSQPFTYFILPYEFWISIHSDRNCRILDNHEHERISCFLLKGEASSLRHHKQDNKLVLEERKKEYDCTPNSSNSGIIHFYKLDCR